MSFVALMRSFERQVGLDDQPSNRSRGGLSPSRGPGRGLSAHKRVYFRPSVASDGWPSSPSLPLRRRNRAVRPDRAGVAFIAHVAAAYDGPGSQPRRAPLPLRRPRGRDGLDCCSGSSSLQWGTGWPRRSRRQHSSGFVTAELSPAPPRGAAPDQNRHRGGIGCSRVAVAKWECLLVENWLGAGVAGDGASIASQCAPM